MTDAPQFTITRIFDAPRDTIWRAWTDPAEASAWWHPRDFTVKPGSATIDARVGGRYTYTMVDDRDGTEYPTAGTIRELAEPARLVMTWGGPGDAGDEVPVLTIDLRELGDGRTEMLFHVLGVDGQPGDDDVYDGWSQAFDILDEHLAGAGVGRPR